MTGELRRVERIRGQLQALDPADWTLAADDAGMLVEARGETGELATVCRFADETTPAEMEFLADAPRNVFFLLGLVDRAIAAARQPGRPAEEPPARQKDYAAEAAMKCAEPGFKVFLEQRHGLERPLTDERCAQKLRGLLGVTSRRELNEGGAALERWRRIRAEFREWAG